MFKNLVENNEKIFETRIKTEIAESRYPSTFWKAVNRFKFRPRRSDHIEIETWNEYLKQLYPPRIVFSDTLYDARHPLLDSEISYEEMIAVIRECKNGKSAGPDGLSYAFIKNLPSNWLLYLQQLFNEVLSSEAVPKAWGQSYASMIHKKGDSSVPENHRCISLMNSIVKNFTQLMNKRLKTWSIYTGILPEFQSGFREKRSCLDNIFVLNSMIQIHLSRERGKLFAFFVDFEGAFPSVNHNKLWHNLFGLGVSSKFVRICENLYERASIAIRSKEGISNSVEVTRGVLQGDTLSPLCFSLYISDMEEYFRERGAKGVSIDRKNEIVIVAYADDIVILAYSYSDLQKKLNILYEYCNAKNLKVNLKKSKILIFQKGDEERNISLLTQSRR